MLRVLGILGTVLVLFLGSFLIFKPKSVEPTSVVKISNIVLSSYEKLLERTKTCQKGICFSDPGFEKRKFDLQEALQKDTSSCEELESLRDRYVSFLKKDIYKSRNENTDVVMQQAWTSELKIFQRWLQEAADACL